MHAALEKTRQQTERQRQNTARMVAVSFVSGSKACGTTGARFTDQDCVSYVYYRTLERINHNKTLDKIKKNGGAGVRNLP